MSRKALAIHRSHGYEESRGLHAIYDNPDLGILTLPTMCSMCDTYLLYVETYFLEEERRQYTDLLKQQARKPICNDCL